MAVDNSLPTKQLSALEQLKFTTDESGDVIVRTSAKGEFRVEGLTVEGRISKVTISDDDWYPLPATALSGRNAMSIQNRSEQSMLINYSNTAPSTVGVLIPADYERQYQITSDIIIYGRSAAGVGDIDIIIEEIA